MLEICFIGGFTLQALDFLILLADRQYWHCCCVIGDHTDVLVLSDNFRLFLAFQRQGSFVVLV